MKQIFDEIRQRWVAATPEEMVRQYWIQRLVKELAFPRELMGVEKELHTLSPLLTAPMPLRRIDIVCFMKHSSALRPLLLVECKSTPLAENGLDQLLAYNDYIQAPYVALVNQQTVQLRSLNRSHPPWEEFPSFPSLIEALRG